MTNNEIRKYYLKYLKLLGYTYNTKVSYDSNGCKEEGIINHFCPRLLDKDIHNFHNTFKPKNWGKDYEHTIYVGIIINLSIKEIPLFYLNCKKINNKIKILEAKFGIKFQKEDSDTTWIYYDEYLIGEITDIGEKFKKNICVTTFKKPLFFFEEISEDESETIYYEKFEGLVVEEFFKNYFETIKHFCKPKLEELKQKIYGI